MISLNTGSAYLQTQISSGFDSVTQGIAQTSNNLGLTGLQAASDSFSSFETSEMTDLNSMGAQQLLSGVAEFSSPTTYLQSQLQDSAIQSNDPLLSALQDSHLATGDELSSVSEILSSFASAAEQQGIIIVSGSPTQLKQSAASKLEQVGLMTPPQIGGFTELEQAGLMTPPQFGGSTGPTDPYTPSQFGGSTKLDQVGLMTPPQVGGSTELEKAGLMTPPQFGGSTGPTDPHAPSQYDVFAGLEQQGITLSPQSAATLANMSKTVRDAANLYQSANLSMLSRRIIG